MKTKILIAGLIAFATSAVSVHAQQIDQAIGLIESERYESAEKLLEKYTEGESPAPQVNYLLMKTYLEQDKTKEAKEYAGLHLNSVGADPLSRISYARYMLNSGDKANADQIFSTILSDRKNKKNPSLLMAIAEVNIEEENGDAKATLDLLEEAAKRDKNNANVDILRGMAYRKLSDASNAYLAFQKALEKEPENVKALYLMGKIFTAQKNPEVYMGYFQKAYQYDSTYAPVLEDLYNHYYFRDVRIAKIYLEKFIANTDHTIQNDYLLTDILYLNGQYRQAINTAENILASQGTTSQPRLYKLMAYSHAKLGDTLKATEALKGYFEKETPARLIAADFALRASLASAYQGTEKAVISYYSIAADMDTSTARKVDYALKIAEVSKKIEDYHNQALWLGKIYNWKEKSNNVDLFNWGIAHYTATEYSQADSVFALYINRYPEDIFGYYWRAQASAAIDTSMTQALAVEHYLKVVEIGEQSVEKHKKMLLKAYGYLGAYEANITKDYKRSHGWFEKYMELDKENEDVGRYIETLKNWIDKK